MAGRNQSKDASSDKSKPEMKRGYLSQSDVPRASLKEALRIPKALAEQYGKHPATPVDVGAAIGIRPTSGGFRDLAGSSIAYGMTEGGYNADLIALTDLGKRIVAPMEEGDDRKAMQEAFLNPRVVNQFLKRYDGSPFPIDQIAKNVLEGMGVPSDRAADALVMIKTTSEELGFLVDINGKKYVQLKGASATRVGSTSNGPSATAGEEETITETHTTTSEESKLPPPPPADLDQRPKPIFIAHGKKKGPLDKLEKVLNGFKIPFKVAISEPNLGRPIPRKVKETMSQCGSGILIFTKDESFKDSDGNDVWRPSENVVFELGAASFAYEDRVVILKEKGLTFPTDFQSVGNIEFEEDRIEGKTAELLHELIGFGLLKVTTT
jgi:hypothetical protein